MPRYNYRCECGVTTEQAQGYDVSAVPCACGGTAKRQAVYAEQSIRGDTVPKGIARRNIIDKHGRPRTDLFNEATQEWDYTHKAAEADEERSIPSPSAYKIAKRQARMTAG